MFGLLAVAAASLTGFAGGASAAPTLTSPAGTQYTGEIHMTLESGTSTQLKAGIEDTCTESTSRGPIIANETFHAESPLFALTFGKCTQDTSTINPGRLTIDDVGTVYIVERRVEIKLTSLGVTCFYGAEGSPGVSIGTLKGGTPARLTVNTTRLKRLTGSNFFCAFEGTWTGSYIVTTPSSLLIT